MSGFYVSKYELWLEAGITAEDLLKYRLVSLENHKRLTPAERRVINAMKRKLVGFIKYCKAASNNWAMNAG